MRSALCTGVSCAVLLFCLLASPSRAFAQHGGGGRGGGGMGGGFNGGYGAATYGRNKDGSGPGNTPESAGSASGRGGLQLGPPGRWWDDKHFTKDLKLRPDQQRRMDGIFEANRSNLLKHFEDYQGEQVKLEGLTHAKIPDEGALYAQIDRVNQARAELEKANAHYLLQLRNEMDTSQVNRLGELR